MNIRFVLSFAGSMLALTSIGNCEDWIQYRGNIGTGISTESISDEPSLKEVWKAKTPFGFSSFSIADGRAFTLVATDVDGTKTEACVAMDAKTGRTLWQVPLGASEYGHDGGNAGAPNNRGGDGPRSTPTTDGKRVYVYDSHLVLSCFEANDGSLVWRRDIKKEFDGPDIKWFNATSPLLNDQALYVGGGGAGHAFMAFDKSTGDELWASGEEKITHATPHLATINKAKQVIFFVQSGLVGIDVETGKEKWRSEFPFSVSTAASPISSGNTVYCSAGYGVGAGLFKVNGGAEAEEVWFKPNKLMNHWSTPVAHDGHLYGIYEFKKYGKAPLNCVDIESGEIKWSSRGFGPGNCIMVGDKLVVLSDAGELVIAKASPDKYTELSRTKVVSGKCWSTPAYANGHVYVRSTTEAACLKLK